MAPGYTYEFFLKAYNVEQQKGYFPYEWVDDLDKLKLGELPPHEAFYSQFKNENISEEQYKFCQKVWKEKGLRTGRDFLVWYNNFDVVPFLDAVDKMANFYLERGMDMFKCAISVLDIYFRY